MSHALVTGGTGFVGGAVVDRLLADGWEVTLLVRDPARVQARHQGRVSLVTGDIGQALPALPAHDATIHCAADLHFGHTLAQMRVATVDGTRRLVEAARSAGTRRFVHVSSQAVYGFDRHYRDADETTPMRPSPYPYCESKRLAEEVVWQASREGMAVTVLRPGFVYGRGDRKSLPPAVKLLLQGQLKAHIDHGEFDTGPLHVENCAAGIVLAASRPEAIGEAFNLGDGRVLTIRALVDSICAALSIPAPTGNFPYPLAWGAGFVVEGVWRLLRLSSEPPLSPFLVSMLHRNSGFSIEKARRLLGYEPHRQWEESLEETLAWCREVA